MGCDIHIIAEVKQDGKWILNTTPVFKNPYFKPEDKDKPADQKPHWAVEEFQTYPSTGRNYDWFSILANVRNGYGFAGCITGEGFAVIADPRGLPEDISKDGLKKFFLPIAPSEDLEDEEDEDGNYYIERTTAERWAADGDKIIQIGDKEYISNPDYHSTSYLSVEDFNNFDWNQVTMKRGVITVSEYKKFRETNESPEMWSGMIHGAKIVTVSTEIADKIIAGEDPYIETHDFMERATGNVKSSELKVFVDYYWPIIYSEWFKHSIENTVEPLRKLKEQFEDARIVFSFDN